MSRLEQSVATDRPESGSCAWLVHRMSTATWPRPETGYSPASVYAGQGVSWGVKGERRPAARRRRAGDSHVVSEHALASRQPRRKHRETAGGKGGEPRTAGGRRARGLHL